jgi:hypothetical protein
MLAHNVFERNGVYPARFNRFHPLLGQINVFQIVQVLQDGLAGVVGFAAAGLLSQPARRFSIFSGRRIASRDYLVLYSYSSG